MRSGAFLGLALTGLLLSTPARALSVTLDVTTPQQLKNADFALGSNQGSDTFDATGTVDVAVEIAATPLDTTFQIVSAQLALTDMLFDFGASIGFVETTGLAATLASAILHPTSFDGIDTYSFDLAGADFRIITGTARAVDLVTFQEFTIDLSTNSADLIFEPGATAFLTVSGASLDVLIPVEATGINVAGVSPTVLAFSGPPLATTGTLPIPEPTTLPLVAAGVAFVSAVRRRRGFKRAADR